MTTTPELLALQDLCTRLDGAGIGLWIASREDLILSKLEWARESASELQMRDVRQLLEGPLDSAYLTSWAHRLGVEALLKEAAGD